MKTKTCEVDASAEPHRAGLRWYAVRPRLLIVLVAELLLAGGLIALEPASYVYWADRLASAVRVSLGEIESGLVCLAAFTIASIGIRARAEGRAPTAGWLRQTARFES